MGKSKIMSKKSSKCDFPGTKKINDEKIKHSVNNMPGKNKKLSSALQNHVNTLSKKEKIKLTKKNTELNKFVKMKHSSTSNLEKSKNNSHVQNGFLENYKKHVTFNQEVKVRPMSSTDESQTQSETSTTDADASPPKAEGKIVMDSPKIYNKKKNKKSKTQPNEKFVSNNLESYDEDNSKGVERVADNTANEVHQGLGLCFRPPTPDKDDSEEVIPSELPLFDEEQFDTILSNAKINQIVEGLKKQLNSEIKQNKSKILQDYKFMLTVTCFKIPLCPKRMVKLKLKHSLVGHEDDVCIFVKDLERGMRVDYEATVHHYEDLFKEKGISGIKIIPFNQLKKEYSSYEAKKKLSQLYDLFLCDGTISGHIVGFLGKIFQKSGITPISVRLNTQDLAREVKKELLKTSYKQGAKGPTISIPVGTNNFTAQEVADNISMVIGQLKKTYPGGAGNIRNIYVKGNINKTVALPLYISMANPPEKTPNVIGQREKKMRDLKAEANQILTKFTMTDIGKLTTKRTSKNRELYNQEQEVPKNKKAKREKRNKSKTAEEVTEITDPSLETGGQNSDSEVEKGKIANKNGNSDVKRVKAVERDEDASDEEETAPDTDENFSSDNESELLAEPFGSTDSSS